MKRATTLTLVILGVALGLGLAACAAPNSAPDPKSIAGRRLIKQATEQAAAALDKPAQAIQVATKQPTTAPTVAPMATEAATAVPEAATAPLVSMAAPSERAGDTFGAEFDYQLGQVWPYCLAALAQVVLIVLCSVTSPRQDLAAGVLIMAIATMAAGSAGVAVFGYGGAPGFIGALVTIALGAVAGGCLFGRWKVPDVYALVERATNGK